MPSGHAQACRLREGLVTATIAFVLFWTSCAALAWVYVLYPLVALVYGRVHPVRLSSSVGLPSLVTVGLAVHDGSAQVEKRIENILADRVRFEVELVVASDGSTDGTPAVVRRLAAGDARIRLIELARSGQSTAQSAIFEAARGAVIVLTDIETRFAQGCLGRLRRRRTAAGSSSDSPTR